MSREVTELLQDFSGGLDTLTAVDRLAANRQPTHSNVWYDDGALQKKPGQLKISSSGNGDTIFGRLWYGYSLHTSIFAGSAYSIIYGSLGVSRNMLWTVAASATTASTITNTNPAGTADTAVASAVVTGHGSNWLTTARPGAMFEYGNTIKQILTVDSDTQITLTGNFGVLNTGITPIITNSWSATARVSYVDMNSKVWVCGPGSTTVSWSPSGGQVFVDAFPQANYSIVYSNYVFAANVSANPSRVYWSALKDPTTWPASNFVDVSPDDGFPIVGMFLDGQSIVILKTNSAWKLTGATFDPANPTYTLTQIAVPSDFVINSPKSVQPLSNGFIMLGKYGFYSYNGSGLISKIFEFDKIRSEFTNIAWTYGNVPSVTAEPCAQIVDGNYWLQVPYNLSTISTADKELTYVIDKNGSVWRWQALANGIISDFTYLNGTLYGVNSWSGGTAGFIQLNTGNSDAQTTAINGTATTKVYEYQNQQRFGIVNIYFKKQSAGNLTFEYQIDESGYVSNTIDMTTGGTGGTRIKSNDITIGRVGRTIEFRLSNNVAAQTFEIYGIGLKRRDLEN